MRQVTVFPVPQLTHAPDEPAGRAAEYPLDSCLLMGIRDKSFQCDHLPLMCLCCFMCADWLGITSRFSGALFRLLPSLW